MPTKTTEPLRFTRIRLENWRNFRLVDVELADRVFLVGPNASGKSNFLDAFRFLHDVASLGLQSAVRSRRDVSRLRNLSAPEHADVALSITLGSDSHPALWDYEIRFNAAKGGAPIVVAERVARAGSKVLVRPDEEDRQDPLRLTQTALEQVSVNKPFREVFDFLTSVFYLHVVPQLVRDPERSAGRSADPFGGDFLEQIATIPPGLLDSITGALRGAIPQLEELKAGHDERGTPHLWGKYRNNRQWLTEEDFSDGTLRLIGLLWSHLSHPSNTLLFEEPENHLHPEIIRSLPQVFARMLNRNGQQIMLSTHSPDLLSDEGIGLDEVLLLIPKEEGTEVRPASSFEEIVVLLEGGVPLPDAVLPSTSPPEAGQLARRIGL